MQVDWLSLPRSSGEFQAHLESVENSLKARLRQQYKVKFRDWSPDGDGQSPLLILFQSQGRPGDEFPGVLPREILGSSQRVVVVLIQNDERSSAGRGIVPASVRCSGVVSVHVVPMQHELHKQGSSLCPRNQEALKEIAQLLHGTGQVSSSGQRVPPQQKEKSTSKRKKKNATSLQLLLLPQDTGAFGDHMQAVGDSLRWELEKTFRVQLQPWAPGQGSGQSDVLIAFQSQGRPGDEFPRAVPQDLRGGRQRVLVAVVQDDEWARSGRDIVPEGVQLISVVNLHVVPGQHQLHSPPGSGLCPRNTYTILEIGRTLGLQEGTSHHWFPCGRDQSYQRLEGANGRVLIHSLPFPNPGDPSHDETKESIIQNLKHRNLDVVQTSDPRNPPADLILCRTEDSDRLQRDLQQLGLPSKSDGPRILVNIQKEGQAEGGREVRISGFNPDLQTTLTVDPSHRQLVKSFANGEALKKIADALGGRRSSSLWIIAGFFLLIIFFLFLVLAGLWLHFVITIFILVE